MWTSIAALLPLFAIASSQSGCCVPDQLQGLEGGLVGIVRGGKPTIVTVGASYAYDFTNKRMAANVTTSVGKEKFSNRTIYDYKKGKMYTIIGNKCTLTSLKGSMKRSCIPADAVFNGNVYYGLGSSALPANTYNVPVSKDAAAFVAVTIKDCAPVAEVIYGDFDGVPTVETLGFVNMTVGIRDPSVFTPPPSCKQGLLNILNFQKEPVDFHSKVMMKLKKTVIAKMFI